MRGISWLAAKPVSFSRRTLLREVSKKINVVLHAKSCNLIEFYRRFGEKFLSPTWKWQQSFWKLLCLYGVTSRKTAFLLKHRYDNFKSHFIVCRHDVTAAYTRALKQLLSALVWLSIYSFVAMSACATSQHFVTSSPYNWTKFYLGV